MSSKRDPKRYLKYLAAERNAILLYSALADQATGDRREALLELVEIEAQHAQHWIDMLNSHGVEVPPAPDRLDPDDAALVARARAAGLDSVLAALEETEGVNADIYDDEPDAPAVMSSEERIHMRVFQQMQDGSPLTALNEAPRSVDFGETWHRGDRTGSVRAAIFGVSDGLVSNTALVMGFAGAVSDPKVVLFAGIAGLLAGAFSMAAGEYISVASQRDLFRREIETEAAELRDKPEEERRELELIYRAKGMDKETARKASEHIMADPAKALDTLAREELGLDPSALGSPIRVALSSFIAFALGAVVVVIPYLFASGGLALGLAIAMSLTSMLVVGAIVGRFSGRNMAVAALRQLAVGAGAATITFLIGLAVSHFTGLSATGA
jgi:VIT1/CCC1 family predicted Fe2+/Mn2+ transporter